MNSFKHEKKIQNWLLEITCIRKKAKANKPYSKWERILLFKKSIDFERNKETE